MHILEIPPEFFVGVTALGINDAKRVFFGVKFLLFPPIFLRLRNTRVKSIVSSENMFGGDSHNESIYDGSRKICVYEPFFGRIFNSMHHVKNLLAYKVLFQYLVHRGQGKQIKLCHCLLET